MAKWGRVQEKRKSNGWMDSYTLMMQHHGGCVSKCKEKEYKFFAHQKHPMTCSPISASALKRVLPCRRIPAGHPTCRPVHALRHSCDPTEPPRHSCFAACLANFYSQHMCCQHHSDNRGRTGDDQLVWQHSSASQQLWKKKQKKKNNNSCPTILGKAQ